MQWDVVLLQKLIIKLLETFQRECDLHAFALLKNHMIVFEASDDKCRYRCLLKKHCLIAILLTLTDQKPSSGYFAC